MCGIAGVYIKSLDGTEWFEPSELERLVDWLAIGIEPRGDHATGISAMDKHGITSIEKADLPATQFCNWRRPVMPDAQAILIHTRWATKGSPKNLLNNHPIEYGNVTAIHNGHIRNDDALFEKEKFERIAQVDSEIIPALINHHGFDNAKEALEKLDGNFAIAAFDKRERGKLLLAKGSSSPLVFLNTSFAVFWASTEQALKEAMEFAIGYEVKSGEIKSLGFGEYMILNGTEEIEREKFTVYSPPVTYSTYSGYSTIGSRPRRTWTDGWDKKDIDIYRDWCDICDEDFYSSQLKRIGNSYYCWNCEKDIYGNESEPEKRGKRWRKKMRKAYDRRLAKQKKQSNLTKIATKAIPVKTDKLSDELNDEHWLVCELVAEKYGTTATFVDHLLFADDDIISVDDPNFVSLFMAFEDEYTELMLEVKGKPKGAEVIPFKSPQDRMIGF